MAAISPTSRLGRIGVMARARVRDRVRDRVRVRVRARDRGLGLGVRVGCAPRASVARRV